MLANANGATVLVITTVVIKTLLIKTLLIKTLLIKTLLIIVLQDDTSHNSHKWDTSHKRQKS